MDFETVVTDVKGRFETVSAQAQDVAKLGVNTFKASTDVVVAGVQDLVKSNSGVAKHLVDAGKTSFEKAKADGFVAVASNPVEYLPQGRNEVVSAFNSSVTLVSKTGEKLVKVLKGGVNDISVTISGKPSVKRTVKKTATSARKTATKAAGSAKKTAKKVAKKATA